MLNMIKKSRLIRKIRILFLPIVSRWKKYTLLYSLIGKKVKILDVGCGNKSPEATKKIVSDCYYVGVDVGDYNQTTDSIKLADEYHIFSPADFANGITTLPNDFDLVMSSHNIEHCNEPEKVIKVMCEKLLKGGILYMSFPNSDSVNFPHREGTLNFYDDPTHVYVPDFDKIQVLLKSEGMKIIKAIKSYKPRLHWCVGLINEPISRIKNKILRGTWDFWGFETIIIAEKN